MRVSLIVAMASNRTIGLDGGMPWHIPEDLKYFKQVTLGAPIVMGRKTYEAIGRALPGRANIVVTRDTAFAGVGIDVVHTLEAALKKAEAIATLEGRDEIFIIGGAQIYQQALPLADRLYVTEIHQSLDGDAAFPEINRADWIESRRELHTPEQAGKPAFSFVVLDRKP
jgi:dihydrofolate reductase